MTNREVAAQTVRPAWAPAAQKRGERQRQSRAVIVVVLALLILLQILLAACTPSQPLPQEEQANTPIPTAPQPAEPTARPVTSPGATEGAGTETEPALSPAPNGEQALPEAPYPQGVDIAPGNLAAVTFRSSLDELFQSLGLGEQSQTTITTAASETEASTKTKLGPKATIAYWYSGKEPVRWGGVVVRTEPTDSGEQAVFYVPVVAVAGSPIIQPNLSPYALELPIQRFVSVTPPADAPPEWKIGVAVDARTKWELLSLTNEAGDIIGVLPVANRAVDNADESIGLTEEWLLFGQTEEAEMQVLLQGTTLKLLTTEGAFAIALTEAMAANLRQEIYAGNVFTVTFEADGTGLLTAGDTSLLLVAEPAEDSPETVATEGDVAAATPVATETAPADTATTAITDPESPPETELVARTLDARILSQIQEQFDTLTDVEILEMAQDIDLAGVEGVPAKLDTLNQYYLAWYQLQVEAGADELPPLVPTTVVRGGEGQNWIMWGLPLEAGQPLHFLAQNIETGAVVHASYSGRQLSYKLIWNGGSKELAHPDDPRPGEVVTLDFPGLMVVSDDAFVEHYGVPLGLSPESPQRAQNGLGLAVLQMYALSWFETTPVGQQYDNRNIPNLSVTARQQLSAQALEAFWQELQDKGEVAVRLEDGYGRPFSLTITPQTLTILNLQEDNGFRALQPQGPAGAVEISHPFEAVSAYDQGALYGGVTAGALRNLVPGPWGNSFPDLIAARNNIGLDEAVVVWLMDGQGWQYTLPDGTSVAGTPLFLYIQGGASLLQAPRDEMLFGLVTELAQPPLPEPEE